MWKQRRLPGHLSPTPLLGTQFIGISTKERYDRVLLPHMPRPLTIFVCSTFADLSSERKAVLDAIRRLQLAHDSMEFFGARSQQPIETCIEEVRRSDIVVVIVGHRYGSTVPELQISYSEAEYNEAHQRAKPCLVYIRDDNTRILPKNFERDAENVRRLEQWKKTLRTRHTVAHFTSGRDLAVQVVADLSRATATLTSDYDVGAQVIGYSVLIRLFDCDPDKWIQWLNDKGSAKQRTRDLPFAKWVKEQSKRDPGLLGRAREMMDELSTTHSEQWAEFQPDHVVSFDHADVEIDGLRKVRKEFNKLWWPTDEQIWRSTITKGAYWLVNKHFPNARRWIAFPADSLAETPFSAEVTITPRKLSFGTGAGLVYRFRESGSACYYSYLLAHDGQLRFAISTDAGEKELYRSRSEAVRAGFNKLGIHGLGAEFHLYVNDVPATIIRHQEISAGGVGILASGVGEFGFRNVTFYRNW